MHTVIVAAIAQCDVSWRFPWDLLEYENCYKKRVTGLPNGETS